MVVTEVKEAAVMQTRVVTPRSAAGSNLLARQQSKLYVKVSATARQEVVGNRLAVGCQSIQLKRMTKMMTKICQNCLVWTAGSAPVLATHQWTVTLDSLRG